MRSVDYEIEVRLNNTGAEWFKLYLNPFMLKCINYALIYKHRGDQDSVHFIRREERVDEKTS